jgi:hypothetical protein
MHMTTLTCYIHSLCRRKLFISPIQKDGKRVKHILPPSQKGCRFSYESGQSTSFLGRREYAGLNLFPMLHAATQVTKDSAQRIQILN